MLRFAWSGLVNEGARRPVIGGAICRRVAIALVALSLAVSGCVSVANPTPTPPGSPQATDAVELLPDPSELFPDPPILEQGDVPPFEETQALTGSLELGAPGEPTSATIGAAGGSIETSGLRIDFAPETLAADTALAVSAAPISSIAGFGDAVTPITPLYTVEGAHGVSLQLPATVTLAADIPAGATAMALYYDQASGTLTPLTPIGQDATSLTAGATHFSSFLGALVDLAKLPQIADSGFRPGADDWQFTNYGSYIEPKGHCEGQSVSAIWYYVAQRKGAGASPLYGLYDNNGAERTPTFWYDDSDGYRFVSVVQHDPIAVPFTYGFLRNAMWDSADQRLTYAAFQAAIALSGEPQLIRISPAPGDPGHTMIVYRVTNERLFIADPNYPARLRTIGYDAAAGTLAPYSSGANAADIAANGATIYTRFAYVPWRSSHSEAAIAGHWAEFQNGTAGDADFPAYQLFVRPSDSTDDADWTALADGYQTDAEGLQIKVKPAKEYWGSYRLLTRFYAYRETRLIDEGRDPTVPLQEGANEIGLHVVGYLGEWEYIDFERYTIFRGERPTPTPTGGAGASPTGAVGSGDWVLQEIIPVPAKTPDTECYFGNQVAVGDGAFSSSGSWKDEGCRAEGGPYYSGTIAAQCTWTPPASQLAVGSTITLTMECQSMAGQTGGGRFGGGQGWMYLTENPPPDNLGGRMSWSRKLLGDVQSGAWSGDLPRSDSKTGSIEIPSGSPGDLLVIYAALGGPGGGGQLIYKYVYGGTGPIPPRATAPPPMTPLPSPSGATPTATPGAPSAPPTVTAPPGTVAQEMYRVLSIGMALNGATAPTTFTITRPWLVTEIIDYHWNNGQGARPLGTIGLRAADGTNYGPWQATGQPGQGGVPDAYWVVNPNVVIPAGTYTVLDSDPATWAQNADTGGAGMSWGSGIPQG